MVTLRCILGNDQTKSQPGMSPTMVHWLLLHKSYQSHQSSWKVWLKKKKE